MKNNIGPGLVIGAFVITVVLAVTYETIVWRRCIAAEPWWYCLRLLGGDGK